ncbi:hypothetical protein A3841_16525 [Pontibacter flavimaris]|uniref:Uncharacterized protein n=1 Tax=Pontibacter flavimaris TaxID=1797110 RepID=A0A1Q5PCP3_9BACT|nr:hypothetical protein A3841_16525 [Pontibacter flavimaris]
MIILHAEYLQQQQRLILSFHSLLLKCLHGDERTFLQSLPLEGIDLALKLSWYVLTLLTYAELPSTLPAPIDHMAGDT